MTTNGVKKQNGTANGQKVIPKDVWASFFKYWGNTEYEFLDAKSIKELLGKYLFVQLPKDVRNRKAIDEWFTKIKEFREKGVPFGGFTVNFAGQTQTLPLKLFSVNLFQLRDDPA